MGLNREYYPIGYFSASEAKPYEVPRQGVLANSKVAYVEILSSIDVNALADLVGFERIWLIYDFHQNSSWRPKVMPPRGSKKKRGVFATRSPYRPNSIGLSCVKLIGIEGRRLLVSEYDLLDETPILDIKPYLPYSDSFPDSHQGWVPKEVPYNIIWTEQANEKVDWLEDHLGRDLKSIIDQQLSYSPIQGHSKRVKIHSDSSLYEFSLKAWRFDFEINDHNVIVLDLRSGYSEEELSNAVDDLDIVAHRDFQNKFV